MPNNATDDIVSTSVVPAVPQTARSPSPSENKHAEVKRTRSQTLGPRSAQLHGFKRLTATFLSPAMRRLSHVDLQLDFEQIIYNIVFF